MSRRILIFACVAAALTLQGCAVVLVPGVVYDKDKATPVAVKLPRANGAEPKATLVLASLAAEPNAKGFPPGGIATASFSAADLKVLEQSFGDTIRGANGPRPDGPKDELRLHVVIRRYVVGSAGNSSVEKGAIACVGWAAVSGERVIHHEQFYATSRRKMGTSSANKNTVDQAIVERVVRTAAKLAGLLATSDASGTPTAHTYDRFEDAQNSIPTYLVDSYFSTLPDWELSRDSATGRRQSTEIDWPARIKQPSNVAK